jgi:hypothetical protein
MLVPRSPTSLRSIGAQRASTRLNQLCTGINSQPFIGIVSRYSNNSTNSCHVPIAIGRQKHVPPTFGTGHSIPSWHSDYFSAKVPAPIAIGVPGACVGKRACLAGRLLAKNTRWGVLLTLGPLYCRAVRFHLFRPSEQYYY